MSHILRLQAVSSIKTHLIYPSLFCTAELIMGFSTGKGSTLRKSTFSGLLINVSWYWIGLIEVHFTPCRAWVHDQSSVTHSLIAPCKGLYCTNDSQYAAGISGYSLPVLPSESQFSCKRFSCTKGQSDAGGYYSCLRTKAGSHPWQVDSLMHSHTAGQTGILT